MAVALALIYILLLGLLVWKNKFFRISAISRVFVLLAFALKVLAGIGLTAIYTYYYTDTQNADIYKYFFDGLKLKALAFQNPKCFLQLFFEQTSTISCGIEMRYWDIPFTTGFYNDNRLLIKVNCLMAFISMNNVFIHSILASFIGFSGLILLIKTALTLNPSKAKWYGLMLLFFPSLLAWTSVVIKETFLLLLLAVFLFSVVTYFYGSRKTLYLFSALASLLALAFLKVYVVLCLLPCLAAFMWVRKNDSSFIVFIKYSAILIGCFSVMALADNYILKHKLWIRLAYKQYGMVKLAEYESAKSVITIPPLSLETNQKATFFKAAAGGFFNAFARPNLIDRQNPLLFIAGIENFLLLIFLIFKLLLYRAHPPANLNQLFFIVFFCLLILTITGITTPVLGSLVRFKVPYYCLVLFI